MAEQAVYTELRSFKRRETIFREGDAGGCAFEIRSGRVAIVAGYGSKREKLLTELGPGAVFGEMGMVRGLPRSATAVAIESETCVSVITWETLGRYFQSQPSKVVRIMQQMGQRIDELSDEYIDACGAVSDLLAQRNALIQENKRQAREAKRMEEELRRLRAQAGIVEETVPVWQRIENEEKESEDKRFAKYAEAYRRYQRVNR